MRGGTRTGQLLGSCDAVRNLERHQPAVAAFKSTKVVGSRIVPVGLAMKSRAALCEAAHAAHFKTSQSVRYLASAAAFIPSSSFLMSSGDNCGRSTLSVSLLSLPVNANGGW